MAGLVPVGLYSWSLDDCPPPCRGGGAGRLVPSMAGGLILVASLEAV